MSKHDDVEAVLARLMPAPLSQKTHDSLESVVHQSVNPGKTDPHDKTAGKIRSSYHWKTVGGMAAALLLGVWMTTQYQSDKPSFINQTASHSETMLLLGQSERVEDVVDEGWQSFEDGSEMHAMRVRLIGESQFHDEETGILVTISEPREEILLMPVSTF